MKTFALFYSLSMIILSCSAGNNTEEPKYGNSADYVQFRLVDDSGKSDSQVMVMEGTGEEISLHQRVLLDLNDVSHVVVENFERKNECSVFLVLSRTGRWKLSEITGGNLGRRLGVVVDGQLLMAPEIVAQIDFGKALIIHRVTALEADRQASRINSILASLPKPDPMVTEDISIDSLDLTEKLDLVDIEGPFLFEAVSISEIMAFEDSLGSKRDDNIGKFQIRMPNGELVDFGQPLEYSRPRAGYLKPHVMYAFSKPDSVVRFVEYTFRVDMENLRQRELIGERYFRLDGGVYPHLKKILISKLGKPDQEDVGGEFMGTEDDPIQIKRSSWERDKMILSLAVGELQSVGIHIHWK